MSSKIVRANWGCPLKTLVCEKNERHCALACPPAEQAHRAPLRDATAKAS
jgi:hypothetical protein